MSKKLAGLSVALAALMVVGFGSYTWLADGTMQYSSVSQITTELPLKPAQKIEIGVAPFPQATRVTGRTVSISSNKGLGSGAIIGGRTVVTVAHVIGKQRIVLIDVGRDVRKWVPAVVMGHIHAAPENIVILQLMTNDRFLSGESFTIGTGIKIPLMMVTSRGVFPWNPGSVVPGDSGSAVLNLDGELIGLVTGYTVNGGRPVVTLLK